ncbi:MAG: universal stress protein [Acidimicrobiales bacterium]
MSLFPTTVLVAVDHRDRSRPVVEVAADLARATESELHLVHVKLTSSTLRGRPVTPTQADSMDEEGDTLLSDLADLARGRDATVGGCHLRRGSEVASAIASVTGDLAAGVLAVGRGRRSTLGRDLTDRVSCTVLSVPI